MVRAAGTAGPTLLTDSNARYHAAEMGYHGVRASHSPKALVEGTMRVLGGG